jgi:hypothetical protein
MDIGRCATEPSRRRPSLAEEASLRTAELKDYLAPLLIDDGRNSINASDWVFVTRGTATFYNFRDTGNKMVRTA